MVIEIEFKEKIRYSFKTFISSRDVNIGMPVFGRRVLGSFIRERRRKEVRGFSRLIAETSGSDFRGLVSSVN